MDTIFEFNGVTYQVTSSIRLNPIMQREGKLYNFSLAILNPATRRKQVSLNCLTLLKRVDEKNRPVYAVHSPMHKYMGGKCAATVILPGTEDNIQIQDRGLLTHTLLPILKKVADESLKYSHKRSFRD